MKVAVIGAGPAGLTAAYRLAKGGAQADVYEAGPNVGGLARTIELWGQRVDLGPHRFFSSDSRVNRLWLEVMGREYTMVDRLTRIFYRGKFFHYPLRPFNALWNLGSFEAARCMASYAAGRFRPAPSDDLGSFEDWVVAKFGRRLFEIFFRTYSEKLWGLTCQDLDADFAAQRIKKLSLLEAVKSAMLKGAGKKHRTLVDRFAYPRGGTGRLYERMASEVEKAGSKVRLSSPAKGVRLENGRARGIVLADGTNVEADHVVSTMPLTLLVRSLPDVPEEVLKATDALTFRNTLLVYLHVRGKDLFPDNWIYVHSPDLRMGRVTNFRNWSPELYGEAQTTILSLEYWCNDDEPMWSESDEELIERGRNEIRTTGLIGDSEIPEGHVVRLRRCYPVYRRGYKEHVAKVVAWLNGIPNLTAIGRYGAFKYNNQDHSILMGVLAAENLLANAGHDLWAVNTDYETYQENSRITETGLEEEQLVGGGAAGGG